MSIVNEALEKALALGFNSVEECQFHAAWIESNNQRHAKEVAYQSSNEAQNRRDAAGVDSSTWVCHGE